MGQIVILGTANAVPDQTHANTHLAILQGERKVLVDSTGDPVVRLERAGISPNSLTDLIITHFHPDHVSSVPILLMDMWLMGRTERLNIYGLAYSIDRLEQMMELYSYKRWPGFFPIEYWPVPDEEMSVVIDSSSLRILSSPVKHLLPTIGLRVEFTSQGKSAAYSCDTEPCEQVIRLARGADLLIHEATGAQIGHTSAAQAGEIASRAGARSLCLIHYTPPSRGGNTSQMLEDARLSFNGPVALAEDFLQLEF